MRVRECVGARARARARACGESYRQNLRYIADARPIRLSASGRDHSVAFASVQKGISSLIEAEAERGTAYNGRTNRYGARARQAASYKRSRGRRSSSAFTQKFFLFGW